jgi:hypothetical protein
VVFDDGVDGVRSSACASLDGTLSVANYFFTGIMRSDHSLLHCEVGVPRDLLAGLRFAARAYERRFGGPPDVVLLKSTYWSLREVCDSLTLGLHCDESLILNETGLLAVEERYTKRMASLLLEVKLLFPEAVVWVKTDAKWSSTNNRFATSNYDAPQAVVESLGLHLLHYARRAARQHAAGVLDLARIFEARPESRMMVCLHS